MACQTPSIMDTDIRIADRQLREPAACPAPAGPSDTHDIVPTREQRLDEMTANEACAAGYDRAHTHLSLDPNGTKALYRQGMQSIRLTASLPGSPLKPSGRRTTISQGRHHVQTYARAWRGRAPCRGLRQRPPPTDRRFPGVHRARGVQRRQVLGCRRNGKLERVG